MTSKSSTPVKLGLVILAVLAGVVAVAANFGILSAHRSSPDVGVLSVTDVSQPVDTAVATTDTAPIVAGPESTQAPATTDTYADGSGQYYGDDDHDGDSDKHDKDHDKHDSGSDKHRKGHDDDDD